MIKQAQVEKIVKYFSNLPQIIAVYLFGSVAGGRTSSLSDIDVAVLLNTKINRSEYFDFRMKSINDLISLIEFNDIDLVILNQATPLLKYEVLKKGKLIYCYDNKERINFTFESIRDYLDTKYMRQVQEQILYRQIKEGSFGCFKGSRKRSLEKTRRMLADLRTRG